MNPNQPDPAFVEHLEWQVRTSLRRRDRFARPATAPLARVARTASLCLLCVLVGAGAVVGAEELQEDRERALYIARARLEVEVAELRLSRAAQELERLEAAFENGLVDSSAMNDSRARSAHLRRSAQRERLELAETEASGLPANDDLAAPLVDGRDYVGERLRLDLEALVEQRGHHETSLARVQELSEAGLISSGEVHAEQAAVAAVAGRVGLYLELLELRARFLRGDLDAADLFVREQIAILGVEVAGRERRLLGIDASLPRTRELVEGGLVPSTELAESEHARELLVRELELLRVERQQWLERSGR